MSTTLTFHGAAGTVTGSNFLLERDGKKLLIDCGIFQGEKYCDDCNRDPFAYDPVAVDALIVTHSHMDHIGRVPLLVRRGFRGPIYSTPATKALATVMFDDALGILQEEARHQGTEPLYERGDVDMAISQWESVNYGEKFIVAGFSCKLLDAGHILGSAMVELVTDKGKFIHTGDLGNSPSPLLADTKEITDADYMVMESVYGDRNHESKGNRIYELTRALNDINKSGGTLMIPAFSINRTQILLYELNNLMESGVVPEMPVYLDSPLAIRVTDVYREFPDNFNADIRETVKKGDDIFSFPTLTRTESVEQSKQINTVTGPKVIIAGSGMSNGGRILHHEKRYLSDKNSILLIVGYQAAGSLGRRLQEGIKKVTIHGDSIAVRADVRSIEGYSAHKDSEHLVEFVSHTAERLKQIFLAMGEPKASMFLAQRLNDYLGVEAIVPEEGQSFELDM